MNHTSEFGPDPHGVGLPTESVAAEPAFVNRFPESPAGALGLIPVNTGMALVQSSFVIGTTCADASELSPRQQSTNREQVTRLMETPEFGNDWQIDDLACLPPGRLGKAR